MDQYFMFLFYAMHGGVTFVETEGGVLRASGLGSKDQSLTAQWATGVLVLQGEKDCRHGWQQTVV